MKIRKAPAFVYKRIRPGSKKVVLQFKKCEYNQFGKEVVSLKNDKFSAGDYSVHVNTTGLTAGVYIYRIETPTDKRCGKLVVQ